MPSIAYMSFQRRTKEEHNFYKVVSFPFVNGRAKSRIQAPGLCRHSSFYSMILSLSAFIHTNKIQPFERFTNEEFMNSFKMAEK